MSHHCSHKIVATSFVDKRKAPGTWHQLLTDPVRNFARCVFVANQCKRTSLQCPARASLVRLRCERTALLLLSRVPMLHTSSALVSLGGHRHPATPPHPLLGSCSCPPAVVLLSRVASKKLVLGLGRRGCGSHARTCNPLAQDGQNHGVAVNAPRAMANGRHANGLLRTRHEQVYDRDNYKDANIRRFM